MSRKIATLFLEELVVLENGRQGNADEENIMLASLIWPRPMIDLRTAARSVRLEDGVPVNFSGKPFHEKILFKEIVGGQFGVTLEITERKTPGIIARFLASIATDVVNAVLPLPPSSETFRRIIHAGVTGAAGRFQSVPQETILRIAFGHAVLDPAVMGSSILEIPLVAPETIKKSGDNRSPAVPMLTQGQPNGHARLAYTIEEDKN